MLNALIANDSSSFYKQHGKTNIVFNICKESRKRVLKNLSAGRQRRRRCRKQTCGHRGKERVG